MPREDTIICMDNSEWMRNGDYPPRSRFEAQYQAIEYLIRAKTSSHPENTVGLISLAGGLTVGAQLLCSPTKERFRVGKAAQTAKLGGKADIITGLKVAQLAFKFRPQRSVQARIILFVGSPVNDIDITKLTKLGKQLRKNNIAVDVIAVGEHDINLEILRGFVKGVEKRDGVKSSLVDVPQGEYIEDSIKRSDITADENEEEMDPMLALALAESRAMAAGTPNIPPPRVDNLSTAATLGESVPATTTMEEDEDEDEILKQAKLMSLMEQNMEIEREKKDGHTAGSALSSNLAEDLLKSAGVDATNEEVQEELKELKKAEKGEGKDKEDKNNSKKD